MRSWVFSYFFFPFLVLPVESGALSHLRLPMASIFTLRSLSWGLVVSSFGLGVLGFDVGLGVWCFVFWSLVFCRLVFGV